MANEVVTIRINVSANTREIDKVKRKLAELSAQSAVTGDGVGDLSDGIDDVGRSSRKSSRDIDSMSRSTEQLRRNSHATTGSLTGMSKVLHNFLGKLGGIGMFVMKAWMIQTALLGAGLVSISAGFKVAAAAGKLFQASMAAVAAGAAAAVAAVTTAAAAYRQYVGAVNAANYTAGPIGSRQMEAMGAFRSLQSDRQLGSLGPTAIQGAFTGISQQTAVTGDMKESLKSLADFAIASGDVEKGMAAAGQFLGALRKEGKITDQIAALGEGLGTEFQTALAKAQAEGKLSETDFLAALNAGSLNQKVAGLLDGVNNTLFGQAKSFMSEAISMAGDIGQTFLPDVQVAFDKMTSILRVAFLRIGADLADFGSGDFVNTIVSATQKLSDFTVNLFEKYLPKADGMLKKMSNGWRDMMNWFRGFKDPLNELNKGGQILIDTFAPFFREFFGGFGDGFKSFNQLIIDNKDKFLEFGDAIANAWDALQGLGDSLRKAFVKSLPAITRIVNLIEKLFTLLSGLTTAAASNPLTALAPLIAGFAGFGYLKSSGFRKAVNKRAGGMGGGGMPFFANLSQRFGAGGAFSSRLGGRFREGMGDEGRPYRPKGRFSDIHTGYMGQRYATLPDGTPNPNARVPLSRQGRFGAGMARGVAAAGRVAPYAMMAGSLFGSQEAQMPLLAGGMIASYNPMLGAGVAGAGMALTSKTPTGGGVSGALGGAALGTMIAPGVGTIVGGLIGGVAGGIMGAVNRSKDLKAAAKAIVDSVVGNTRKDIKDMQVAGEKPADIKKELANRKRYANMLGKSATLLEQDSKDMREFGNILEWAEKKGVKKEFMSGKMSAKEVYALGGGTLSDAEAASAERGRGQARRGLSMRNRALRGLKDQIPEEQYNKLKKMLDPANFNVEAVGEVNKMKTQLSNEQKKLLGDIKNYESNIAKLSRASGLAGDEIAEKAAAAGVDLYESGLNLAETLDEIGAALPKTLEEANQRFRAKSIQGIEDVFNQEIAKNDALKALDQIGEEIRSTKGPIAEDQSLVYMRDWFQQSIAAFPDDMLGAINSMRSALPGGSQYMPGSPLEGREKDFGGKATQKGLEAYSKVLDAQAEETAGFMASAIAQKTGKNIDLKAFTAQLRQFSPEQVDALKSSAVRATAPPPPGQPAPPAGGQTVDQVVSSLFGGAGLSGFIPQFTDASSQAALNTASTLTSALGQSAPLIGAGLSDGLTQAAPQVGQAIASPIQVGSTAVGQNVSNGFGFGAAGHGVAIGNAAAGPMKSAVASAIASAPALKVAPVPPITVTVNKPAEGPKDGDGDTTSSRLASTMARHRSMDAMLAGNRNITSSLRTTNLGSLGSDHATGNAYDLVGQNLGAYQRLVQTSGGFAEFHNDGGRHLHVVPGPGVPAGDSATPAMVSAGPTMSTTSNNPVYNISVNGGNASPEAIADSVMAKIAEKERSMKERS
jgi:hypothetical protein